MCTAAEKSFILQQKNPLSKVTFCTKSFVANQMSVCHYITDYRYEDVKTDSLGTVRKMLDFLRFPYDPRQLEERMKADYGTFKRLAVCVCVCVCVGGGGGGQHLSLICGALFSFSFLFLFLETRETILNFSIKGKSYLKKCNFPFFFFPFDQ